MDSVLHGLPATSYIDDIVVASNTWEEHLDALAQVCLNKNIALKLRKCCFASASIDYLGHVIGSGSILPQTAKIDAILQFPLPETRKQLKSFLGMIAYYRPHIPQFSLISGPLDAVTGKTSPRKVIWTQPMREAFHNLKQAFKEAPILSAPDPGQPFYLTTDACATGMGAALTQVIEGETKHLGFFSKRLKPCQGNYSATELETFAIHSTLRHFAPFLYGSFVYIQTDHKPLLHIDTMANDNKKLMRWVQTIQQFPHSIIYLPGKNKFSCGCPQPGLGLLWRPPF
jgi:hypothetical protein